MFSSFFWLVHYSLKTFQANLIWCCHLKNNWNQKSCCQLHYTILTKVKPNRREINITFFYRAELFLYSNHTKNIIFCSLIVSCQDYALRLQCTWLSNCLKITFIIIKAHVNKKACWKMFLQLYLLIWSAIFSFQ